MHFSDVNLLAGSVVTRILRYQIVDQAALSLLGQ
jgi:hypothetical protein